MRYFQGRSECVFWQCNQSGAVFTVQALAQWHTDVNMPTSACTGVAACYSTILTLKTTPGPTAMGS